MSEVVFFELGTWELRVVPKAWLFATYSFEQVPRLWEDEKFDLIDTGANKRFMTWPCGKEIEKGDRYLATVHWNEQVRAPLVYERTFWVGPIDRRIDALGSFGEVGQKTDHGVQMSG